MDSRQSSQGWSNQKKNGVNSERAAHRRAVLRTVHDVREQLNSHDGFRPSFRHELMLMYAKNRTSSVLVIPILLLIVGAISTLWTFPIHSLCWIAASFCVHFLAWFFSQQFEDASADEINLDAWYRRFIISEFFCGLVWASILLLPTLRDITYLAQYQFAIMLVAISVTTMHAFTLPQAVWVGVLPISTVVIYSAIANAKIVNTTMPLMSIGALVLFLMLAKRLYDSTLAMLNFRVEKDFLISELEQAKAISDESRHQAEEANAAKSHFLATMSHELRTPLNAILGFSEIMQNEVLGPVNNEKYKEYVNDIHTSGSHLLNLINEILDLSRIEAGRQKLNEEAITLAYIAEDCQNFLRIRARNKEIEIKLSAQKDLPKLWADERAVRQIILNLLTNAVKFTPQGGNILITVRATPEGGQYVCVEDNGPGIPEAEIATVLSAFGQGSLAIKSAEEGTGLGLSIVQAMMELHNGKFELTSELRQGTKVKAIFPPSRVMDLPTSGSDEQLVLRSTG